MSMITFRLDDITPAMDWERFEALVKIFSDTGIYPLLGIVPDNQDKVLKAGKENSEFWDRIKQLENRGFMLAQHGYQHIYETTDKGIIPVNAFSEFAGLPCEVQEQKIRKGRELLKEKEIVTDIFMAPGHTLDKNTLEALKLNGFEKVTDGYAREPYRYQGMNFYPCTLSEPGLCKGVNTVCLHPNHMTRQDMEQLRTFIDTHKESVYSYGDMLAKAEVKKYTFFTFLTIRRNLLVKDIKKFAAENQMVADYMQKTYHENRNKKLIKRILYSPMLLWAFITRNRQE